MNNKDPDVIYLAPHQCSNEYEGRAWCENDNWDCEDPDDYPVKYIRHDLHEAKIKELENQIELMSNELDSNWQDLVELRQFMRDCNKELKVWP